MDEIRSRLQVSVLRKHGYLTWNMRFFSFFGGCRNLSPTSWCGAITFLKLPGSCTTPVPGKGFEPCAGLKS
jgi:hypothetical protein